MLAGDALVAEVAVDLIDFFHTSNQEPFQVKLRRNAEIEVDVEGIVVCHEGPGGSTAGDGMHHGGLHLDEAARL